jgi:hypothetical protein
MTPHEYDSFSASSQEDYQKKSWPISLTNELTGWSQIGELIDNLRNNAMPHSRIPIRKPIPRISSCFYSKEEKRQRNSSWNLTSLLSQLDIWICIMMMFSSNFSMMQSEIQPSTTSIHNILF